VLKGVVYSNNPRTLEMLENYVDSGISKMFQSLREISANMLKYFALVLRNIEDTFNICYNLYCTLNTN